MEIITILLCILLIGR